MPFLNLLHLNGSSVVFFIFIYLFLFLHYRAKITGSQVLADIPIFTSFPPPQGLIDVEKEVAKLMTKKGDLEKQMEKLREKMGKNDYKEKVPVKVQEQDAEKVGKGNWLARILRM